MKPVCAVVFHFALTLAPPLAAGQDEERLYGEWRFADIRNAEFAPDAMTPPLFDVIVLRESEVVRLENSLYPLELEGRYELEGDAIRWTFESEDAKRPIEHRLGEAFTEDGALSLRSTEAQDSPELSARWIYLRPGSFLETDWLEGHWTIDRLGGEDGFRELGEDGAVGTQGEEFWGVYRLWQREGGLVLTTLLWVEEHGAYVTFDALEKDGKVLQVTPRTPSGLRQRPREIWMKTEEPPETGPEARGDLVEPEAQKGSGGGARSDAASGPRCTVRGCPQGGLVFQRLDCSYLAAVRGVRVRDEGFDFGWQTSRRHIL